MSERVDRIAEMFVRTRARGRPAVIAFVPGGWPEPGDTPAIVRALLEGGADAVEIGMPFSDPLADGVTNQRAYQEALAHGVTVGDVLRDVRALREGGVRAPLLVMGYFNPLLAYGVGKFVHDASEAGVDGVILVDLPPEEAAELESAAHEAGLHPIYLLAPTSTEDRITQVAGHAGGFVYCVSVTGVTGARDALAAGLPSFLARVRAKTDLPLAVGFGIAAREQVEEVGRFADAAVIGSALVEAIANAPQGQRPAAARAFLEEITGRETGHPAAVD